MRKRTLLLFILLLLTPLFSAADDTDLLSQEYTLLAGRGNQASEIRYSRSEADIFMDSLTDVMREELVRSVLSENDEIILARMLWGEDRENPMYMRAAVIWCVFNRMDQSRLSVEQLITRIQFPGYREENPVTDWAVDLIRDVTIRYVLEQNGFRDAGRVLPREYLYYEQPQGKRYHIFKTRLKLSDTNNKVWDWSLPSPYSE